MPHRKSNADAKPESPQRIEFPARNRPEHSCRQIRHSALDKGNWHAKCGTQVCASNPLEIAGLVERLISAGVEVETVKKLSSANTQCVEGGPSNQKRPQSVVAEEREHSTDSMVY